MHLDEQLDSKAQIEHERENEMEKRENKDPAEPGYDNRLDGPNRPSE